MSNYELGRVEFHDPYSGPRATLTPEFFRTALGETPMKFDVTVHLHVHDSSACATTEKLDYMLALLKTIVAQEKTIMANLDALEAEVKKNTDVEASAVVLIQGLADQIAAAGTDPVKLEELRMKLSDSADSLAQAVAANTKP